MSNRGFTVQPARYAKGKMLVCVTDSRNGLKGRSSYLLDALNARYTHREHGYILSPAAVEKLIALYDAGFDARLRTLGSYVAIADIVAWVEQPKDPASDYQRKHDAQLAAQRECDRLRALLGKAEIELRERAAEADLARKRADREHQQRGVIESPKIEQEPVPPPTDAPIWGDFPTHEAIKKQRRWWRLNRATSQQARMVELVVENGDLIDDTGDSPPLVLRSASGLDASSFAWYLKDRWAPVLP